MSIYLNAALTAFDLARELAVLGDHGIGVVYGVFDIISQRVQALPDSSTATFGPAPLVLNDFQTLADAIIASLKERGILDVNN
jgi:nucleotide-binding universal stress UspA family protein